jgi:hypothetical protein
MWNNNGNGQGNGYGQQPPQGYQQPQQQGYGQGPQDTYDRLNNARQITNRDPYIEVGTHKLAVISLEEFQHDTGPAIRARFEVLESTAMRPGTTCGAVWFLTKPAPKQGMVTDSDRFADFCMRLKGAPAGYPIGNDIRVLLKERANDQLARGMVITAVGINKVAKTTGKAFTVVHWNNVPQDNAQIAQMRMSIEQRGLANQNAPAPQTGGPAQLGYAQPQGAPQGYAQQPPQGRPPQGYQQPMQPQYGQPQGAAPGFTPPPQQGYGQPQQPMQPQGVPPGGFLGNVPPQGGNNGNGGQGGW